MSSKITLITGGSRSGKSSYAERIYDGDSDVLYIATAIVTDPEMEDRVEMHKKNRDLNWEIVEEFKNLDQVIKNTSKKNILLDSVTLMVMNLIYDKNSHAEDLAFDEVRLLEESIIEEFEKLIAEVRNQGKNIILVTNEVGYGIMPEYRLGRIFSDIAGRLNQRIASLCDAVYFVSCGLPLKLK